MAFDPNPSTRYSTTKGEPICPRRDCAAVYAALNAGAADVERLRRANGIIKASFASNASREMLRATTDLYEILFTVAGQPVAWSVVQSLNARINRLRGLTIATSHRSSQADAEMRRIIDAIAARDADAAARASFDHVRTVATLAQDALRGTDP